MKKDKSKTAVSDLTEFTDEEGKRWVQTSTEDLFSSKEFNDLIESMEKDREEGEIVLARIDFQKVNKEYYETALELQQKLEKQTEILQKVVSRSQEIIDRKNKKLKELIQYIRKLHYFIANLDSGLEYLKNLEVPRKVVAAAEEEIPEDEAPAAPPRKSVYEEVEEIVLGIDDDVDKALK